MEPSPAYRDAGTEQQWLCADCGITQPDRDMLLSSRGRVCVACSRRAEAPARERSLRRDAAVEALLLGILANLPGVGMLLISRSWITHPGRFAAGGALAIAFAALVLRRARELPRGSIVVIAALVLSWIAALSSVAGMLRFALS